MTIKLTVERLYDLVEECGLLQAIYSVFGKSAKIDLGFSKRRCEAEIERLSLSVRSCNALQRAKIRTVQEVIVAIGNGDPAKIRNLGAKSLGEIRRKVCEYGYNNLSEEQKSEFLRSFIQKNAGSDFFLC